MELEQMLNNIGWEMAERGIDEAAVRQVVAIANRLQVAWVATAVLADTAAPYVARCRAFARVAGALRASVEASPSFTLAA